MAQCPVCQCEFTPKPKRRFPQIYCSDKCRNKAWVAQHGRGKAIDQSGRAQAVPPVVVAQEAANAVSAHAPIIAQLQADVAALKTQRPSVLHVKTPSLPATWKHGANCYRNHGCRCPICVAGVKARDAARRFKASKKPSPTTGG